MSSWESFLVWPINVELVSETKLKRGFKYFCWTSTQSCSVLSAASCPHICQVIATSAALNPGTIAY